MRYPALKLLALLLCVPLAAQAQDWAKARLDKSPRHHEYVSLHSGDRTVQAFVVYPEVKQKAPVVVLIHEIFGLTDWAKEMADEIAASGYIVIAPDLLSGHGPNGGGSDEFPSQDGAVKAVSALNPDEVMSDLDAAADYAKKIPAANGKLAVAGFCWGGGKSFALPLTATTSRQPSSSMGRRRLTSPASPRRFMASMLETTRVSPPRYRRRPEP
jgi:carboxymethylenebutenolidase